MEVGMRRGDNAMRKFEGKMSRSTKRISNSFSTMGSLIGGAVVVGITKNIGNAALAVERFEARVSAAAGSSKAAAIELTFVRNEVKRLGLDLMAAGDGFSQIAAAAKGTELAGAGVRDIFTSVSEASAVMKLSADDTKGAFRAISQIMSKGTVQAEELRGQLGERVPGAFQIAARAMGKTTQELGKMLEMGQVTAVDFLPKFAEELKRTFNDGLPEAVRSSQAQINRFGNMMVELKNRIAQSGLFDAFLTGLKFVSDGIVALEFVFWQFAAAGERIGITMRDRFRTQWVQIGADFERLWVGAKKMLSDFIGFGLERIADLASGVGKLLSMIPTAAAAAGAKAAAQSATNLRMQADALNDYGAAFAAITANEKAAYAEIAGDTENLMNFVEERFQSRIAPLMGPEATQASIVDNTDTGATTGGLSAADEAEIAANEQMTMLRDGWRMQEIAKQMDLQEALLAMEEETIKKKKAYWDMTLGGFTNFTAGLVGIAGKNNKKMAAVNKAFAAIEAVRNMWLGVSAGVALGWPKGIPAVAWAIGTGMKAISAIGGGGGGGVASASGSPAAATLPSPVVNTGVDTGATNLQGPQEVHVQLSATGDIIDLDQWMADKGAPAIAKLLRMGTDFGINQDAITT
jgi:tape measure domain-containing protein